MRFGWIFRIDEMASRSAAAFRGSDSSSCDTYLPSSHSRLHARLGAANIMRWQYQQDSPISPNSSFHLKFQDVCG
jgi:hypothetical protein